jgi:hypothetical protein
MTSDPPSEQFPPISARGMIRLTLIALIAASTWGMILPWLGQRSVIAEHITNLRAQNIDPSARYYSDLETLPPVVHRLEKLHTTHHAELWGR